MSGATILQVVRTYLPRPENWIYHQVNNIERYRSVFAAKATANLDVFPFDPLYSLTRSPLKIRLFDRAFRRYATYSTFFEYVAAKEDAKVIHAHGGGIATYVSSTAERLKVPLVVSFYGVDMWKHPDGEAGLKRKYADVFRTGAMFLAEGPAAARQLARIGGPETRIMVHRLGVDVAAIPFVERSRRKGELRVLMANRFVEKKGIPYGVEAFSRVARDNPGMRLKIVGDSGSSKDALVKKEILEIARRHGVEQQVSVQRFMSLDALQQMAQHHDILLHPSVQASSGDAEGGHPVVMTMLAAGGMPILSTRHCDVPEVVHDTRTGWLVSERSSDEIETVLRAIVSDSFSLPEMGRNARNLVTERYDIRTMRLDSVYDAILGNSPGA